MVPRTKISRMSQKSAYQQQASKAAKRAKLQKFKYAFFCGSLDLLKSWVSFLMFFHISNRFARLGSTCSRTSNRAPIPNSGGYGRT